MINDTDETTLDPEDWPAFRARAHQMLDAALDQMENSHNGAVWTPLPDDQITGMRAILPKSGDSSATDDQLRALLPHGVGNTHPRFFGWVHGSGTPSNILADMIAAAMNANLGGRDHGAIYVEKQVVEWVKSVFDFPADASGIVVSGTSIATLVALKAARDRITIFETRKSGVSKGWVEYTASLIHI